MPDAVPTVSVPISSLTTKQAVHATLEIVLALKQQQDEEEEDDGVESAIAHIERNTAVLRKIAAGLNANNNEGVNE